MVNSRTDGAPTLPISSEEEMTVLELQRLWQAGEINDDTYWARKREIDARSIAAGLPEPPPSDYQDMERQFTSGNMSPEEFRRGIASFFDRPAEDTDSLDMPGPMTGSEEDYQAYMGMRPDPLEPMRQEGRDFQNARDYGRRVGGEAPFASEAEAAEYGRRNLLTPDQERELRAQGMSDQEIKDQQRSQFDRDMAQAGYTGGTGWVPVLGDDGRYTYMERAPASPGDMPSATETAIGHGNRSGPRVDSGALPLSMGRPDLERRGYVARELLGPYGYERVYRVENVSPDMEQRLRDDYGFTDEEIARFRDQGPNAYKAASRAMADQRRSEGMAARAGVPLRNADGTQRSNMELRQLIRENRQAQLDQRKEAARRARMASRPRNELGLMQLSDTNLSDWERAALFAQITDDVDGVQNMTPLGVEAANMQQAYRLAGAALQGGGVQAEMDFKSQMEAMMRQREGRTIAFNAMRERQMSNFGGRGTRAEQLSRARDALQAAGYGPQEIEDIMRELEEATRPGAEPPAAGEPPPPQGRRVPAKQGGGRGGRTASPPDFGPGGAGRGRSGTLPGRR